MYSTTHHSIIDTSGQSQWYVMRIFHYACDIAYNWCWDCSVRINTNSCKIFYYLLLLSNLIMEKGWRLIIGAWITQLYKALENSIIFSLLITHSEKNIVTSTVTYQLHSSNKALVAISHWNTPVKTTKALILNV